VSSALWLCDVAEPVGSVSARAIAPPPLATRRPAVSTQTPAARRNCVEILVSLPPAIDLVGRLLNRIVAQFRPFTNPIPHRIWPADFRQQTISVSLSKSGIFSRRWQCVDTVLLATHRACNLPMAAAVIDASARWPTPSWSRSTTRDHSGSGQQRDTRASLPTACGPPSGIRLRDGCFDGRARTST
jgi:hypothetical protein